MPGSPSTACSRFPEACAAPPAVAGWLCLLALALVPVAGAAEVEVHASRNGDSFDVTALAAIDADVRVAWEVLTDYDRLSAFIPGMHSSRLLSRTGNQAVVEQRGEASLLFFHFPIEVRLSIEERAPDTLVARAIAGNFRELEGAYRLEAEGARTRLSYHGRFTPDFDIPPLIGTMVVRHTLELRFRALVQEMLRRQAQRQSPAAEPGR